MHDKLKLEVGKKYRRRDGVIEKLESSLIGCTGSLIFRNQNDKRWFENGVYDVIEESRYDLIEAIDGKSNMKNEICIDKKYRARNGREVEIIAIKHQLQYPVIGIISGNTGTDCWGITGDYDDELSSLDLIEVNPYEEFEVDDAVLVKDHKDTLWVKAHFSHISYDSKYPFRVFCNGTTSFTNNDITNGYTQCIKWGDRTPGMFISDN